MAQDEAKNKLLGDQLRKRLAERLSGGKVSPEAMQVMLLDEIAGRLGDVEQRLVEQNDRIEHIRQEMPRAADGYTDDMTIQVSDSVKPIPLSVPFSSCQFNNDGPSPVFIGVNKQPGMVTPLNAGEQTSIDMREPKIKELYFVCAQGLTASVRVFMVR